MAERSNPELGIGRTQSAVRSEFPPAGTVVQNLARLSRYVAAQASK